MSNKINETSENEVELQDKIELFKPPPPRSSWFGESLFFVAEGLAILFIGLFCTYGEGIAPNTTTTETAARDMVQGFYPFFQDVHVMIFVGFGFLMIFIKTNCWTALCFNWVVSIWALQWGILSQGFWHQVIEGKETLDKINITLDRLIVADFGAGACMITFGAILGKCNLQQLFFLTFWEMLWWGLNESICVHKLHVTDMGGSMLVHAYGAYFGVTACYFFQPDRAKQSKNAQGSHMSETVAFVGAIFLWMFWPSFNGALASGVTQHRTIVNTVLAISGSCISSAAIARLLYGKLETEIMLNATLAGGVAIGTSADLIVSPWAAIFIGFLGGVLSALGFAKIGPWLSDKINLQDTCGVNNLHGMPAIMASIVSAIVIANSADSGFPEDYFGAVANGGTLGEQASNQIFSLLVTLAISMIGGLTGGWLCSLEIWQPVHTLFSDVDHFEGCIEKFPAEYLHGMDEEYEETKATYADVKTALSLRRALYPEETQEGAIKKMTDDVWDSAIGEGHREAGAKQVAAFLTGFVRKNQPGLEISAAAHESFFNEAAKGAMGISREELAAFVLEFTKA